MAQRSWCDEKRLLVDCCSRSDGRLIRYLVCFSSIQVADPGLLRESAEEGSVWCSCPCSLAAHNVTVELTEMAAVDYEVVVMMLVVSK